MTSLGRQARIALAKRSPGSRVPPKPDVGEDGEKAGELIGQLRGLAGMGIETAIGAVPNVHWVTPLEIIGREVIPAVADL
jgi:hypothetical protein